MRNVSILLLAMLCLLVAGLDSAWAQETTMGLIIHEDGAFVGYTLFAPMPYHVTYLIDNDGLLINSWASEYRPAMSAYILENGNILRAGKLLGNPEFPPMGGSGGIVQEIAWDGSIVWEFEYSSDQHLPHHDIEPLPNGNVLIIAWEYKSGEEAIEAGRDPDMLPEDKLWPDHIIEVEPEGQSGGNIVWEWHVWDHLIQDFDPTKENYGVVEDHPELLDINYDPRPGPNHGNPDWNHMNSIDYNEELDQILMSSHTLDEIYVIDHSTTTEEAAGHSGGRYGRGGDLLYRWGNPEAYRAGNQSDRKLFKQHDARWVESDHPGEGNMTIFNNGRNRPEGNYSSIDEIEPPIDTEGNYILIPGFPYGPEEPIWIYTAENPYDFYAQSLSGAQRLPNGNTLICNGPRGTFFEITLEEEIVWLYINPVNADGPMFQGDPPQGNAAFWTQRYAPDFPGFDGRDMTPGDPIERYHTDVAEGFDEIPDIFAIFPNYPNPFNATTTIKYNLPDPADVIVEIYDLLGRRVETLVNRQQQAGYHQVVWDAKDAPSGIYFYRIQAGGYAKTTTMVLLK